MRHLPIGYLVGLGTFVVAVASCTQDFDALFDGPETVTVTIIGTGGSGGATTTTTTPTTTTTSTTGQGGSVGGGGGTPGECTVPTDCGGAATTCQYPTCIDFLCGLAVEPAGTACFEAPGANVCDGAGTCVECNLPEDCPTAGDLCIDEECIPPECTDDLLDGNETDVDCGGPDCPECVDGLDCLVYSDCESQFCDAGTCTPCATDDDCTDATGTWCDPTANGGNGGCVPTGPLGTDCAGGNECTSGYCVDDVCCEDADCPGECNTCAPAGTCVPAGQGSPCDDGTYCNGPDACDAATNCISGTTNPCPGDGQGPACNDACNEAANNCTGNDTNTVSCDDGLYCTGTDTCNGSGSCVHAGNPCSGHNVGPQCNDSCNEGSNNCTGSDANTVSCDDGAYCNGADTCNGSGSCVHAGNPCAGDGVGPLCNDACNEGLNNCTANDADTVSCDDGQFCTGTDTCNGSGSCVHTGNPCTGDGVGPLCNDACNEGSNNCTGNDADTVSCDDGLYCTGTDTCDGNGSCAHSGDPCAALVGDCDADCSESCSEGGQACVANDPLNTPCDKNNNCQGGTYDGVCNGTGTCI